MRTVSAWACARVQSRLNAAAAAAEVFSSVLREVGIVSLPLNYYCRRDRFFQFSAKYLENTAGSQPARAMACARLLRPVARQAGGSQLKSYEERLVWPSAGKIAGRYVASGELPFWFE